MKTQKVSNKVDYGFIQMKNRQVSGQSFEVCGLSLGFENRSTFEGCHFSSVRIKKCSVGFPVFRSCHFEDVIADRNGILVYGAALSKCVFTGTLRNVVIGFMWEHVPMYPDKREIARRFQDENIAIAEASEFAIDLSNAELENVGIRGEAIIPYVRCARNQALILNADDLFEKLRRLGLAQANRAKSDFFLGTGAMPGSRVAITTISKDILSELADLEDQLRNSNIEVTHFA